MRKTTERVIAILRETLACLLTEDRRGCTAMQSGAQEHRTFFVFKTAKPSALYTVNTLQAHASRNFDLIEDNFCNKLKREIANVADV